MKKAKNIIMNGFMSIVKSRHNKHIAAAAVAVLLAAAVVMTSVFSRTQAAENADTLMGIEKLRNRYAGGEEYTILEIVPDINAAEIGYLFDGYEPVLSEWDSETMTWKSWKDILCGMSSIDDRRAFIAKKKEELQAYYDAQGLKDNVPVAISKDEYDDSEEYKEGYDEVEAGSYDKTGYFEAARNNVGAYYVSFEYINYENILKQPEAVYYNQPFAVPIVEGMADYIADGTYIYRKDGSMYECAGTWGEYKNSISLPSSSDDEDTDDGKDKDDDNNKDDDSNKDDNTGDDGSNGDGENEGGTGTGDGGNEGGDGSGDGEGGNTGTGDEGNEGGSEGGNTGTGGEGSEGGSGETGTGGEGSEGGSGETGTGGEGNEGGSGETGTGDSGNEGGSGETGTDSTGNSGSGTDNGGNESGNSGTDNSGSKTGSSNSNAGAGSATEIKTINVTSNKTSANAALITSLAPVKWTKFVSEASENQGNASNEGAGANSGDGSGGDQGEAPGENQGGNTETPGENQGGNTEIPGDNQGSGSNEGTGEPGDNQGADAPDNNKEDNTDDNSGDGSGENPDNDSSSSGDASDKNPDKNSGKDNISYQEINAQNVEYYLVYFDRITDVTALNDGAYVVKNIMPAKYASYSGEAEHLTGQYNFIEDREGANTQTYTFPGRVLYCKGVFRNNEWFKQYVLNMSKDNFGKFKTKVITLTPADLTNIYENGTLDYEKGTIPDFDFLYLNSGLRPFITEPLTPPSNEGGGEEGGGNTPGSGEEGGGNTPGGGEEGGDNKPDNSEDNSETITTLVNESVWQTYVSQDAPETPDDPATPEKPDNPETPDNTTTPDATTTPDNTTTPGATTTPDNTANPDDAETPADTTTTENPDDPATTENPDDTETPGDTTTPENPDDPTTPDDTDNPDNTEKPDDTENPDDTETPASSAAGNKSGNKTNASESVTVYNTGSNDLDMNIANMLFTRVAAKALPCLVDGSILYGKDNESGALTDKSANTENTQIFRLAAMLCQETLEKDYTGVSKEKLLNGIEDADKNFTTEQVYCRLGSGSDSIINDNFFKYTIYKEGGEIEEGYQNVLDEILLENLYRESDSSGNYKPLPTNISQAEAIRHILNYQNRRKVEAKKSIKVLEIQPAYTTEPELTKKQLQKWAPGVEEVETEIMTTAEFIGKIDKLNEIYDLIYIGTSKEHLNLNNWVTDTGKSKDGKYLGSTVFNDSDMDGLIYYNVGDKRVVNLPLSGLLDSEYRNGRTFFYNFVRYSGNDITKEKKDALLSFLNGSYPIIVSDEFIEQPVTVFEDDNFAGRRATLDVGEYKESDLLANQVYAAASTPAKGISSLQVKAGYQVTLFAEDNFEGAKIIISSDADNLTGYTNDTNTLSGQTWNNRCRSMIVEKIEDAQPRRNIDGNHIDNSSYLYELVNTALEKKYTNFYVRGDIDETGSELFKFYLNRPKANLIDFTANGLKGDAAGGNSQVNDVYYIYPNTIGRYTLQYGFTIQNEGAASMDTRYNCKLYIDVNADGKFSDFEEVSDIVMLNRSSGGVVPTNELYAGVPYTVTREVPNGYKGLLPWKLEVCQVNNDNIYASEQGYTKLNGMNKETLKVCQINKNTDNELRVIDLNYEIETEGRYFHTLVYGGDYGGVHYPGITADFDLDVETIDIATFEKHYKAGDPDYNPDYLDGFNMLIIGFSDAYDDFNGDYMDDATPLGAVVEFINSGKSVLMAHDTTSYFNNPIVDGKELGYLNRNANDMAGVSNKRFAANINKYIRPLVGMDRYGVLSSPIVKKGAVQKEGTSDWKELFSTGKEVAYKPKSGRTETVPEAQGYTYAIINVRDTDENGNEKKDYTKYNLYSGSYNDREDFTNSYVNQRYDDVYYDDSNKDNGEINSANTSGKAKNVHVTQVNKGQITEYPYKLQEEFEVAQTHAQYYQLDYTADDDGDGQSDLVVWYCLGGRTSGSEAAQKTIYSQSPNDVRNNYYIYNKGNITYTGMGHGANDKKKKEDNLAYTFEEAKLFINTIIASYQAGVKPPTVTVLESGLPEASQLTTMYRYYDEAHMMSITDKANTEEYERVYFTVRDLNFVKGSRVIATHAYYHIDALGGSENISVDGEEIPVIPLADNMFDAANDAPVDANNLISGDIYYILVPKTVLAQCENGLDIYFEAQSTITTNTTKENVYTTDKVYAKLQVLRAYLFELD